MPWQTLERRLTESARAARAQSQAEAKAHRSSFLGWIGFSELEASVDQLNRELVERAKALQSVLEQSLLSQAAGLLGDLRAECGAPFNLPEGPKLPSQPLDLGSVPFKLPEGLMPPSRPLDLVGRLRVALEAARLRGEPLEHCLFDGPSEPDSSTLAAMIAKEQSGTVRCLSGSVPRTPNDLLATLRTVRHHDVLFIDEIHRVPLSVSETLCSLMKERCADFPGFTLRLQRFTLVGATTQPSELTGPLRGCFGLMFSDEDRQRTTEAEERYNAEVLKYSAEVASLRSNHERLVAENMKSIEERYNAEVLRYNEAETQRNAELARLRLDYERLVAENMKAIDALGRSYESGEPSAIIAFNTVLLERSKYPEGLPQRFRLAFVPESKQLVVDYELPTPDVIPGVSEYRCVKRRDRGITVEKPRKSAERKSLYQELVAAIALRTLHEILSQDRAGHVLVVTFSGWVQTVDPATGKDIRPYLISVRVTKQAFLELDLARVEKRTCLRNLGAQLSPQPSELLPVKPILEFDMADRRFVQDVNVLDGLDSRPNLMDLNPYEFEILTTDLFTKMGLEAKHTRSSKDGGVDAVAFDTRPALGGRVVIQAKRYRHMVGVAAVRDLYGTMINEGANKGILITTSGYGPDAFDFAKDKPIELIDGSGLLYLLEQVGVKAKIVFPPEAPD